MSYDTYTNKDGVQVQYKDGGVLYTYNGKSFEVNGEYDSGEVWCEGTHGEYWRNGDDMMIVWDDDSGSADYLSNDEDEWEAYALKLLTK